MDLRKSLSPNNSRLPLSRVLFNGVLTIPTHQKAIEAPSVFTYSQAGRQNSEGFGGGRIVTGRTS